MTPNRMLYGLVKRILDLLFSCLLIIIFLPLLIVTSLAIKIESPDGPVFFRQKRTGKGNTDFCIYKFRSMKTETEREGRTLSDRERLLIIGWLLRKTSCDELPQIFNILKGDMSFIGPRPLPVKYMDYYTNEELQRHDVRPGVSGWAQVNGRNNLSWDQKFELDLFYVRNLTFALDVRTFLLTLMKVFKMSDVGLRGVDIPDISLHQEREKTTLGEVSKQ